MDNRVLAALDKRLGPAKQTAIQVRNRTDFRCLHAQRFLVRRVPLSMCGRCTQWVFLDLIQGGDHEDAPHPRSVWG